MPWFPQSWCNAVNYICSAGQEPDNDRGEDSSTSGKTQAQLNTVCELINTAGMEICRQNQKWGVIDYRGYLVCEQTANARLYACYATGKRLTGTAATQRHEGVKHVHRRAANQRRTDDQ